MMILSKFVRVNAIVGTYARYKLRMWPLVTAKISLNADNKQIITIIRLIRLRLIRSTWFSYSGKWWRQWYKHCTYDYAGMITINSKLVSVSHGICNCGIEKCMMRRLIVCFITFGFFCEIQAHKLNALRCCSRLSETKLTKLYDIIGHHNALMNWYTSSFRMAIASLLNAVYTYHWWDTVTVINSIANYIMFA